MSEVKKTTAASKPQTPPIPPKKVKKVVQIKTVTYATMHADYFDADVNHLLADGWDFMTDIIVSSDSMRITAVLTKEAE